MCQQYSKCFTYFNSYVSKVMLWGRSYNYPYFTDKKYREVKQVTQTSHTSRTTRIRFKLYVYARALNRVQLFDTPRTAACQAPLSMGFPRQEYWKGLPLPSLEDRPNPGIYPLSLASPKLQAGFLSAEPLEKPRGSNTIKGETDHQPRMDAWDKRSDLVLWEALEGAGGEGGGRGNRDGEDM